MAGASLFAVIQIPIVITYLCMKHLQIIHMSLFGTGITHQMRIPFQALLLAISIITEKWIWYLEYLQLLMLSLLILRGYLLLNGTVCRVKIVTAEIKAEASSYQLTKLILISPIIQTGVRTVYPLKILTRMAPMNYWLVLD